MQSECQSKCVELFPLCNLFAISLSSSFEAECLLYHLHDKVAD